MINDVERQFAIDKVTQERERERAAAKETIERLQQEGRERTQVLNRALNEFDDQSRERPKRANLEPVSRSCDS